MRVLTLRLALLIALLGCSEATPVAPPDTQSPADDAAWVRTRFVPLGGWRLAIPYVGEGLAIIPDATGDANAVVTSGHVQQDVLHRTPLTPLGAADTIVLAMPVLVPSDTVRVATLFPTLPDGQRVRDLAVVPTASGFDLAAIGRVFYQTAPRSETRIVVRAMTTHFRATATTRDELVPLPEQEFSGFIKHTDATRDPASIGGGGYESGQGSVAGISFAMRRGAQWQRLMRPPGFGDLQSPRLPRDTAYSCPDGASWVCLPPVNGRGVWSTERVFGGGVRLGDTLLFFPALGYGARTYARQTATFGDPSRDRTVLYRFVHHAVSDSVAFVAYTPWPFTAAGQSVHGMALGRLRGVNAPVLFVLVSAAWGQGVAADAPVLLAYRIVGAR
jgi:hypothetical protein